MCFFIQQFKATKQVADYFVKFAETVFERYKNKAKYWMTFNEINNQVKFLQKLISVSKEETIAFGDGLNDIELFEISRFKVAMDDAYKELKEKANLIAVSNGRDGVLETLELLI